MKVFEFEEFLTSLKIRLCRDEGRHGAANMLNSDEGIIFGDGLKEISSVQVSWMANIGAIQSAAERGASLMLVHEPLLIGSGAISEDYLSWPANRNRLKKLSEAGISVMRLHGTMDGICVFDDFARALGLGEPVLDEPGYITLYDIQPCSADELAERVKKKLGMAKIRVASPLNPPEIIQRIGLPWGGMGLSLNAAYQASLMRHAPGAFISGETDSCAMHFAADSGIYLVETGHEISENFGISNFSKRLAAELPAVQVTYFETKPPFSFK